LYIIRLGWDAHGDSAGNAVDIGLVNKCRKVDRPITALILDLKQRGLLDETLVIWGAEFEEHRCRKIVKERKCHSKGVTTMQQHSAVDGWRWDQGRQFLW
jgi:hypothetical protein